MRSAAPARSAIERVLVADVDHAVPISIRLVFAATEMMDPEVGAVRVQLLGRDAELNGLQERVCGSAGP